jgi:hypothetical protein
MPPKKASKGKKKSSSTATTRVYKNLTKQEIKEYVRNRGYRSSPSAVDLIYEQRVCLSKDDQLALLKRSLEVMKNTGKMVTLMDKHVTCLIGGGCKV